jgi:enoyl-CoA hydratase/carnithine racemase
VSISDYDDIRYEVTDGVAVITLHRPEVRNAFGGKMREELGDAYRRCDVDDAVRAVVLTGTPPAFCAGADLSAGGQTFGQADEATFDASPVSPRAWEIRKPVVAAVNGHAIGLGFTLALQCDLRIVAADAKCGVVQVRRGVMGDAQSHWTITRIAGLANAAEVLLTGRTFDGSDLLRMGLANRCLPADEVLPAALEIARDIAVNTAPLSVAFSKRLLWEGLEMDRTEVGRYETELHHHLMGSADAREGVMAFLERRDPEWTFRVSADWPGWPERNDR